MQWAGIINVFHMAQNKPHKDSPENIQTGDQVAVEWSPTPV